MRRLAPVLLLLLAGCGPKLGRPDVSYAEAGHLPLVHTDRDRGRWYVVVDTGEHGERLFFLDTGYSYTTCDDDFAADLGLELKGRSTVYGEAGTIRTHKARLPPMTVGGHQVQGWACMVRDLDSTSSIRDSREVPTAGVLGSDVLRRFRVVIDPTDNTVQLLPPDQVEPLDPDDPDVVPMRREYAWGMRATVPIVVDGDITLRPVLDTGASGTYVDGRRLHREPTRTREGVEVRASGSEGSMVQDLSFYTVDEVRLGSRAVEGVTLTDRRKPRWVAGLVGLNVLGHYLQEYDYAAGLARFTRVVPSPVPSWRTWNHRHQVEEEAE